MSKHILIGIAGGTGSGKSLVAKTLIDKLGDDHVAMIQQDAYYYNLKHLSFADRSSQNFDHPDAYDERLLLNHIKILLSGGTIEQPIYDFSQHLRKNESKKVGGQVIIILDGILVLHSEPFREMMKIKVYVDTDADIRLIRRLQRDLHERGRNIKSILEQYEKTVRPMHLQFVEPSKRYADIIIPQGGKNFVAIDLLKTKIESILQNES